MRETTAAQCPIHPLETQPCPVCLATMDNSMASYNTGHAAGYRAAQAARPPREPTQAMLQSAVDTVYRENGGLEWSIAAAWRRMHDAWHEEQNGVQRDAASPGCALGASSLESGNAREATCLGGEHDARRGSPTQQGQLGTNAGSIPAAPTDPIADLCAELRATHCSNENLHDNAAYELERLARTERLLQACVRHETARAERAEAERDALRAVVRAADAIVADVRPTRLHDMTANEVAYGRARAKWEDK